MASASDRGRRRVASGRPRWAAALAAFVLSAVTTASRSPAGEANEEDNVPSAVSRDVHAFYYPWYANPETDGRWGHWDHWVDRRGEGGPDKHSPPDDLGSPFYPALGAYSSNDPATLRAHMRDLGEARIGVASLSWWGRGSFEDRAVPAVLAAAAEAGIAVCFHIEPYARRDARSVAGDLEYLVRRYGGSPAFYRRGGRPLVYVYDSYLTPREEWAEVLAPEGEHSIRGTPYDALIMALYVKEGDEAFVEEGRFDGFYTYFATTGFTYGSTPENWPRLAQWARDRGKLFIPSVGPGYDDGPIRPWNVRNRRGRENGAYYDRMFLAAIGSLAPAISITSFNEWHEGTQIEPAVPKETGGRRYLDYGPRDPRYYLERTRHWVERFETGVVMTVRGPDSPLELGVTLPHEHILCDFIGAERTGPHRYDREEVIEVMLPHLEAARERGTKTFVDCTPAFIGRDPAVLRGLAESSGLHILTSTGYYGAAGDKFLPPHAFTESAEELAERWVRESWGGIGESGIRPGFLKIGVDPGSLSEVDRKLARAAAIAHLRTGLPIACHTGEGKAALAVLEAVTGEGAGASSLIVVHADGIGDLETEERIARAGAWLEYDAVGAKPLEFHTERIAHMVRNDLSERLLLSHDAGWYRVGEEGGAEEKIRPYTALFDELLPALHKAGIDERTLRKLTVENPARAFRIEVRR